MNKLMTTVFALVAGTVGSRVLAATEVVWDQSTLPTSLADGKVTAAYDTDGMLTELSTDPAAAGGLKFTGGMLTLATNTAAITAVSGGEVVFSNFLSMSGIGADSLATLSFLSDLPQISSLSVAYPASGGSWATLIDNMELTDISEVSLQIKNYNMAHMPFVWAGDGQSFYCEFQHWFSTATLRAFIVEFRKTGTTLEYRLKGYRHLTDSSYVVLTYPEECVQTIFYAAYPDIWPAGLSYSISTTYPSAEYTPTAPMTVNFSRTLPTTPISYALAASNGLYSVGMKVGVTSGATVSIGDKDALPWSGAVEVGSNGVLVLDFNGRADVVRGGDHGVPITVRKGGLLTYKQAYQLSIGTSSVILDGGDFQSVGAGEPGNYVRNFTLRNGAKMYGSAAVRVRSSTAVWKVEGDEPCFCECGFTAWRGNLTAEGVFTLDVEDVTGDDAADFIVSGPITRGTADDWNEVAVAKTGAGTMSIETSYGLDTRPTEIRGGTLRFGDGVIGNSCAFAIAGGMLAMDDAATNVCQSLAVEASGGIRLGAGASLSFGDCSEQVWAQDAVVTVSGDLTQSKLRFGTSPAALTQQQLKQITFEGDVDAAYRAVLDDNGYLNKTSKSGLIVILR